MEISSLFKFYFVHEENLSFDWFKNLSTFGSRIQWHKYVDWNVHRHWTWIFIFLVIIFTIRMLPGSISTNKCHHFCHPSHFTESTSPVGSVQKSSKHHHASEWWEEVSWNPVYFFTTLCLQPRWEGIWVKCISAPSSPEVTGDCDQSEGLVHAFWESMPGELELLPIEAFMMSRRPVEQIQSRPLLNSRPLGFSVNKQTNKQTKKNN